MSRIEYSGICGSQLGEIDGAKGEDKFLPHLLGHEGSGAVVATGPGVRHVKEGDTVVLHWRKAHGIEATPPRYSWRGKPLNAGWVTTFNQYAIVAENRVTRIDPHCDLKVAALYGCAVTTGFGVVVNNAKVKLGEVDRRVSAPAALASTSCKPPASRPPGPSSRSTSSTTSLISPG